MALGSSVQALAPSGSWTVLDTLLIRSSTFFDRKEKRSDMMRGD